MQTIHIMCQEVCKPHFNCSSPEESSQGRYPHCSAGFPKYHEHNAFAKHLVFAFAKHLAFLHKLLPGYHCQLCRLSTLCVKKFASHILTAAHQKKIPKVDISPQWFINGIQWFPIFINLHSFLNINCVQEFLQKPAFIPKYKPYSFHKITYPCWTKWNLIRKS